MAGAQQIKVAQFQKLKEGKGSRVCVNNEEIALFKVERKVFAVGNVCPHQHFSKLHEGMLEGKILTCPMHGWSYDLESGKAVNADGKLKTFAVEVCGDDVFLVHDGDSDTKNKIEGA